MACPVGLEGPRAWRARFALVKISKRRIGGCQTVQARARSGALFCVTPVEEASAIERSGGRPELRLSVDSWSYVPWRSVENSGRARFYETSIRRRLFIRELRLGFGSSGAVTASQAAAFGSG
jgi:hypothetical protein